ncbi:hypothetical protein TBLA_0E01470 [Henningerozyma blattae CBS 6284]|uniref:Uncharacterized protein n=1 Tax=Henningerozyma blattae (strain ATCC 34711 / CBS 6284 / DSM 70876 / NBRC 10599 / NRRL Y-10934 / UCD 77-7) TaxID=1071380 RepID=I2H4A3_HENB6|nr:hypothetical protein TBLA_0E01470 [Tetrapisispora blattae CBS 6284]CCH61205.1 hypothetical protein TBLA_0E01470 [Tetrapisispora blattae CBS 6284]
MAVIKKKRSQPAKSSTNKKLNRQLSSNSKKNTPTPSSTPLQNLPKVIKPTPITLLNRLDPELPHNVTHDESDTTSFRLSLLRTTPLYANILTNVVLNCNIPVSIKNRKIFNELIGNWKTQLIENEKIIEKLTDDLNQLDNANSLEEQMYDEFKDINSIEDYLDYNRTKRSNPLIYYQQDDVVFHDKDAFKHLNNNLDKAPDDYWIKRKELKLKQKREALERKKKEEQLAKEKAELEAKEKLEAELKAKELAEAKEKEERELKERQEREEKERLELEQKEKEAQQQQQQQQQQPQDESMVDDSNNPNESLPSVDDQPRFMFDDLNNDEPFNDDFGNGFDDLDTAFF